MAPADELLCNVREMLSDCSRIRRVDLGNNEKRAASTHGHCDITGIVIAKLLVVCAAWLVISVLLAGVGALVRTRFGSRIADETDLFFDWWVGWAVTIAYLLAWHLVLAITVWAWVPIALAGGTGAWMARKDWSLALQPMLQRRARETGLTRRRVQGSRAGACCSDPFPNLARVLGKVPLDHRQRECREDRARGLSFQQEFERGFEETFGCGACRRIPIEIL